MDNMDLRKIYNQTNKICHICGGRIDDNSDDFDFHNIIHESYSDCSPIYFPIHKSCKKLRHNYSPKEWRKILSYGVFLKTFSNKKMQFKTIGECYADWLKIKNWDKISRTEIEANPKGKPLRLTDEKKKMVLKKTNCHCHICGGKINSYYEIEHILPRIAFNIEEEYNLLPAHQICNRKKWLYKPNELIEVILLGIFAFENINAINGLCSNKNLMVKYKEYIHNNLFRKLKTIKNKVEKSNSENFKLNLRNDYYQLSFKEIEKDAVHYEFSIAKDRILLHLDLENINSINLFKSSIDSIKIDLENKLQEKIEGQFKRNNNWYWYLIDPQNQEPWYLVKLMKKFIELTKPEIVNCLSNTTTLKLPV